MSERTVESTQEQGKGLKRRGILAAAGAAVAGLVAKHATQPVAAGIDGDVILGSPNSTTIGYTTVQNATTGEGHAALVGVRSLSTTFYPFARDSGIQGISDIVNAVGVQGVCNAAFGIGVVGESDSYYGVQGYTSTGIGVVGTVSGGGVGTSNIGVLGQVGSFPASQPNTVGVYGQNLSHGTNSTGVLGQSDLASGTGIKGVSGAGFPIIGNVIGTGSATNIAAGVLGSGTAGPGVQGQSTTGHGLVGTTAASDGHAGLIGNASAAGGIGLMGIAPGYGTGSVGLAGDFFGNVKINGGTLTAPVMQAVVKHQGDNSYRALHTVVSPEGWVEDFGKAKLVNGTADITLDPDFAALVHTDDYHVFLTEYDDHHSLFATKVSATGFLVQAKETVNAVGIKAPTKAVSGTFSYRVVAKRKDIVGERLAKVAAPSMPKTLTTFTIPETPLVKTPTKQP